MGRRIQITEYLDIDLETEQWCCNRCGRELISARDNYKKGCLVAERDPREIHAPVLEGAYSCSPAPLDLRTPCLGFETNSWMTSVHASSGPQTLSGAASNKEQTFCSVAFKPLNGLANGPACGWTPSPTGSPKAFRLFSWRRNGAFKPPVNCLKASPTNAP